MTARIPVLATTPAHRVAIAGLPERAVPSDRAAGAIVMVDGAGAWWDVVGEAIRDGARAVLVTEPGSTPPGPVARLGAGTGTGTPVLVHRGRLHRDLVDDALGARGGTAPRVTVAECRADRPRQPAVVRDAIGWVRELVGSPVEVAATGGSSSPRAVTALLSTDGRVIGTLSAIRTPAADDLLRVRGLGETTTEIALDGMLDRIELTTASVGGRLVAPTRFESGDRAALRRTLDAIAEGSSTSDLVDLLHDAEAAADVLRSRDIDL
ncbi:hypothetical protein [Agromyces bracchium]|uniref:Uncharacterized protein n=1 Tax=Agromyces bracchium TaxID=88376 RepID=A0A6I3M784_9MICO|nr:hypothetical protein [Agromyces bracchium]MTH69349.1 hypothetical protein [Agromyces bracchium]